MHKEVSDYLLEKYEQNWSAEAHQAVEEGKATGDQSYIATIRLNNEFVRNAFIAEGEEGVNYLSDVLNNGHISCRERAAAILGEIGDKVDVTPTVSEILTQRAEKESEGCVSRRIQHSLEKLAC